MTRLLVALVLFVVLGTGASTAGAQRENRWPASEERAFVVNCEATSGGKVAACKCALNWLEQRYTYRQIASIYLHDQPRLRAILLRAVAACR